jgi:hypothetical protein
MLQDTKHPVDFFFHAEYFLQDTEYPVEVDFFYLEDVSDEKNGWRRWF